MTDGEFHAALPSSCGYQCHFRNYSKEFHAIPGYHGCWAYTAYVARFDTPEGAPDVYGKGYCVHPASSAPSLRFASVRS